MEVRHLPQLRPDLQLFIRRYVLAQRHDSPGSTTIVNGVSYNAANQLLGLTYNGVAETRSYNSLNQLITLEASNVTSGILENLGYNYPTGTNNGKIGLMVVGPTLFGTVIGETVTYAYDSLNRLLSASGTSGWSEQYGFDAFGNLLSKTPGLSQTVNTANNQINGYTYDANGNTSAVANSGITYNLYYDAENRMSSVSQSGNNLNFVSYFYDAQNRRIWNWTGTQDSYGNMTNYTVNVYTPSGQKLGAYLITPLAYENNHTGQITPFLQVALSSTDQYFGSRRLSTMDQLGSVGTFYPWGEVKGSTNPQNTWSLRRIGGILSAAWITRTTATTPISVDGS